MFPWLPEPQTCMPFQTLPSSSLKMMLLKPCGVYVFSERKLINVITPSGVLQYGGSLDSTILEGKKKQEQQHTDTDENTQWHHNHTGKDGQQTGLEVMELLIPAASGNGVWLLTIVPIWYFQKPVCDSRLLSQSWWPNLKAVGDCGLEPPCAALNTGRRRDRATHANGQRAMALVSFYTQQNKLVTEEQFTDYWKGSIGAILKRRVFNWRTKFKN